MRLLIFDRHWNCRLDRNFKPPNNDNLSIEESMQLLRGSCYSLKTMLERLSPSTGRECNFTFRTNRYRLYYFEASTGWRFVLLVGLALPIGSCVFAGTTITMDNALRNFYSTIFIEWVLKNPLVDPQSNATLGPGGFNVKLDEFFALSIFI